MKLVIDWSESTNRDVISILCEVLQLLGAIVVDSISGQKRYMFNGQAVALVEFYEETLFWPAWVDGVGGEDQVFQSRLFMDEHYLAMYASAILEIAKPRLARAFFDHTHWPRQKAWIEPSAETERYLQRAEQELAEDLGLK